MVGIFWCAAVAKFHVLICEHEIRRRRRRRPDLVMDLSLNNFPRLFRSRISCENFLQDD